MAVFHRSSTDVQLDEGDRVAAAEHPVADDHDDDRRKVDDRRVGDRLASEEALAAPLPPTPTPAMDGPAASDVTGTGVTGTADKPGLGSGPAAASEPRAVPEPTVLPEPTAVPEPTAPAEPTAQPGPVTAPDLTAEPEPAVDAEPAVERATPSAGTNDEQTWRELLVSFVDGPREAVDAAQALVSDELAQVVRAIEDERDRLCDGFDKGAGASTEDLRVAIQGLRALSERLHTMPR